VVGEYAEQLFQAGRPADAKPLLDKLHRIAPRYYRTAYLDALFLARDGKLDEAHDAVSKVLAKLPDHAPSLLLAAQTELERGQLASATTHVEQLLAKHPSSLAALRLKLALDVRNGDIQSAAATLARALQVSPNDRGLLAASADLAWARGDRATALKQLAATAQTQPLDAKLLVRLAEMRSAVGQKAQAAESITQAIELARDDANLRGQILRSLTGMGMLDKAKALAGAEVERRPKEPEPLLWLASVLGMTGDEKAALEQTGRSLDLQPDYYPALLALGRTANSPERAKEYQARLQKAVDAGTKNPTIYLDFARKLTIDGADAATVGSLLEKGLSADPASVPVRRALVSHWLASNMKDKAVKVAAEGDASQPDNVALRSLAAATYEAVGDFDKAASKYAELEARFPDRAEWGMSRARVLLSAGKPQDAMLALRKVTADHPEDPAAYRMLAFVQADQKLLPDALVTADMLAAKSKLRAAGLLLRGDLYARTQDKSEAIKAYDEAAKAGATEEAMIRRVELQDRTGGEAFAAGELSEWMKAHPGSVPALSLAARRAAGKQDHATAIRHLEAIVKLQPGNAVALNELAWTYVLAKNPAALPTAGKAAMLLPDNPQVLDTLAEALALAGRKAEAVAKLKEASALAPGNPVFRVHLAELVAEQGNKKDAAALIEGLEKATLDKETAGRLKALKGRL
jgi:putative PEP-CTERM system TPR-repeat lipoprotein